MFILSACCISPQDTFEYNGLFPSASVLEKNRLRCIEPDYKTCIADATLRRRMSRTIKMGVAAALRCVERAKIKPDSIITATGLGCLSDTEKFLDTLIDNELQLNPTPFIQSTFNTVGAQIAFILGNHGYNNTYVHRGVSLESALLDAKMQTGEGVESVLAGCFDEITDTSFKIMHRLGFRTTLGEGASFFMLGSRPVENRPPIQISGVHFFTEPVNSVSASSASLNCQISNFLASMQKNIDNIDLLLLGNNGDTKGDEIYDHLIKSVFTNKPYCFFKNLCGEYSTASGFALYLSFCILAMQNIPEGVTSHGNIPSIFTNVLIYNHYQKTNHSLILIELRIGN